MFTFYAGCEVHLLQLQTQQEEKMTSKSNTFYKLSWQSHVTFMLSVNMFITASNPARGEDVFL
jgi:hypothetical protein